MPKPYLREESNMNYSFAAKTSAESDRIAGNFNISEGYIMGISLFERMGGTYHREGDYFLPDLSISFFRGALFVISCRRGRYLDGGARGVW